MRHPLSRNIRLHIKLNHKLHVAQVAVAETMVEQHLSQEHVVMIAGTQYSSQHQELVQVL
jgi:hypothetical protein